MKPVKLRAATIGAMLVFAASLVTWNGAFADSSSTFCTTKYRRCDYGAFPPCNVQETGNQLCHRGVTDFACCCAASPCYAPEGVGGDSQASRSDSNLSGRLACRDAVDARPSDFLAAPGRLDHTAASLRSLN